MLQFRNVTGITVQWPFGDFSSLRTHIRGTAYCIHLLCALMAHVKSKFYDDLLLAYKIDCFQPRDRVWRHDLGANGKIQKEQEQTEAQPDGA
jgi:hypothetical protein